MLHKHQLIWSMCSEMQRFVYEPCSFLEKSSSSVAFQVGLSQVEFVRDFTSRMWNSESPFSRVQKMMKKTETTLVSVSATVNRVYLGSLLQTGSFAKFFACAATIS